VYRIGQTLVCKGNFTMRGFVEDCSPADLERRVGFEAGRLSQGYAIAVLAHGHQLAPDEFELQGSTRWSGGFTTMSAEGRSGLEDLLASRGQSAMNLKTRVCRFLAIGGANRPAKVLPFVGHTPGMSYPDAEALGVGIRGGIPQFNLVLPRLFAVVSVWHPGA
jgi:hypothetical protein